MQAKIITTRTFFEITDDAPAVIGEIVLDLDDDYPIMIDTTIYKLEELINNAKCNN